MVFRVLFLLALIAQVGPGASAADASEDSDRRMGGEGFGNIVMMAVGLGALLLLGIVAIAVLALFGVFENTAIDPPV